MNNFNDSRKINKLISLIQSIEPLEPSNLGWVVAELIKHELSPGGPYLISANPGENIHFTEQVKEFVRRQAHAQKGGSRLKYNHARQLRNRYAAASAYINRLPESLRKNLTPTLRKIQTSDSAGEIGLISTLFYESYFNDTRNNRAALARQLDIVNILVWVSYAVYDNAVDNPTMRSSGKIPAANALLRVIESILAKTEGVDLINSLLNDVDVAMTEESNRNTNSTFTNLSTLRDAMEKKSIAHIAGPLILVSLSAPIHINTVRSSLEQYCAARQLLDDLYDWRDDVVNKQTTYANFIISKCETTMELHAVKRKLTEEALSIAQKSLNELCTTFNLQRTDFTRVTIERIIATMQKALASDNATIQTIESFTSAYRDS